MIQLWIQVFFIKVGFNKFIIIFVLDPINAEIEYWPKDYRIGSMVHLDCLVRNQRTGQLITNANVVWYIDSDIPLLVDQSNRHHYMILPNNTLIVYHLTRSDSGEYRCRANIGPQTDAFAAVKLQIESKLLAFN